MDSPAQTKPASAAAVATLTGANAVRRTLAAFRYRDFRILWLGSCTSSIGTWMQNVAENWLVLSLSGSAFYLGLDAFLQQLPIMLFSLIGGVLADRFDRRKTLLVSQYIQMTTAFTLAALVFFGLSHVWPIMVLSFITGSAQAFGGPASQALVPTLVEKNDLPNAIALNSIQFNLARVVGPAAGRRRAGTFWNDLLFLPQWIVVCGCDHCIDDAACKTYAARSAAADS